MARRPGRDGLTDPTADPGPGRRRALLGTHLALGALLAVGAIVLIGAPSMFSGVVGLLLVGELVLLGLAGSIGALYERFGPLVGVDVLVGTPVVAALTAAESLDPGVVTVIAIAIALAALAAAVLAAAEVRVHRLERVVLALALVAFALAFWSTPIAAAVPLIALGAAATPIRPGGLPSAAASGPVRGRSSPAARRSRRPDPGAVLGARSQADPVEADAVEAGPAARDGS